MASSACRWMGAPCFSFLQEGQQGRVSSLPLGNRCRESCEFCLDAVQGLSQRVAPCFRVPLRWAQLL